ncbi:MAG: NAD(P)-binding domain-containing protein [Terrimicrobiaceae bacterium]|nr:NAD(P)-binding domain-containing protein [Terrimicrobiaceae bacterium]
MLHAIARYTHWLHTKWPAGTVERLPIVREDGTTNVPGLRIVGDLTGIPLLKFAADSGAKAARAVAAELKGKPEADMPDVAIIGAGVSGVAAAIEARKLGLRFVVFEATRTFSTVANFPKGKPIYTYPEDFTPEGDFQVQAKVREGLLDEMEAQREAAHIEIEPARIERAVRKGDHFVLEHADKSTTTARRVIVAIGRSGNFRRLGCAGEDLPKVSNRLYDPKDYAGKNVLVVGGGDSALEAAIALAACGAHVTLSYRKKEFARPKPANLEMLQKLEKDAAAPVAVEKPTSERVTTAASSDMRGDRPPGSITLALGTTVNEITPDSAVLSDRTIPNDAVFTMIGREAPLEFFRRSGVQISGEWRPSTWAAFGAFFVFCSFIYLWKASSSVNAAFKANHWFPFNLPDFASWTDPFLRTIAVNLHEPGFYYSVAYCVLIFVFGIRRIQRRKTPYITAQTATLFLVQFIPLFLLPYVILPPMGYAGWFDQGLGKTIADNLFPIAGYGHGREYWRAFGFILAWPLFIWNVFTSQPLIWWLVISLVQTFVIIPLIVLRWGKGAYCGWICSCGALAETMGDTHRHKMPHGPLWNRMNMVGQAILAIAAVLFFVRVLSWSGLGFLEPIYNGLLSGWQFLGIQLNYYQVVDVFLAGTIGVACYFWFSGRVWCRFACPLAALMHVYARFSRFRIFPEKSECISCNVCTSVCHQGIDIMNFANKGLPMEDPQCVRCSACVQSCPTGVLAFGRLDGNGVPLLDKLPASRVRMNAAGK